MKQMKLILSAVASAVLLFAVAPARASDADERIVTSFENSYVYKTYLNEDTITITAKDGIVTLSGNVSDDSHKELARETAENFAGVVRVDNDIKTAADVAEAKSDAWIGRKVKFVLFFHRNVSSLGTTIQVKEGVVTLKGSVENEAQKELTAEYAKDVEGVLSVNNEMTVVASPETLERTPGEKIDDASVVAQVKSALSNHRSTSAIRTKVVAIDGVVNLTGIAANDAEKALVTKLVSDIRGVTETKNEMTIEPVPVVDDEK